MSSIDAISSAISNPPSPFDNSNNPMSKVMSSVADLFGISTDELRTDQQNGQTLADIAKQKGISTDQLQSTLTQALQANAPANAPSNVDFSQMATDMMNGTGPRGHGHHHKIGERFGSTGDNTSTSGLSDLLAQNGIDPSELESLLSGNSSDSSTSSSSPDSDFVTQLQNLLSQYGSKGQLYDSSL